jgi:chromosome segregation ATPase
MARALKVFRTPIGFHDAYVAAPSQKAALEAWGADANLFARGAAEQVTDLQRIKDPLAEPGKVIKRPRASAAEYFASLAKVQQVPAKKTASRVKQQAPRPRPSRKALDEVEEALAQEQNAAKSAMAALEERQARLKAEIRELREKQARAFQKLEERAERERRKYEAALARWRTF